MSVSLDRYRQIVEQSDAKLRAQAEAALAALLERIRAGDDPQTAIDAVLKAFNAGVTSDLATVFSALLATQMGRAEMRDYPVGGVKLSDRLYANAQAVSATTRAVIEQHLKGPHAARELAKALYEGYDFKTDPLDVAGTLETLPKYLKVEFNKALAAKLKTPALRAAYLRAIRDAEAGKGMDALAKVLKVAFYERNRYFANRIARTELHRAFSEQRSRELMATARIQYVQLRLSSKHPKTDICDLHAKLDAYGLGAGVYPKARAPQPPFHPHCYCLLSPKIDLDPKLAPRFNPNAEPAFMAALPAKEARNVAGSWEKRRRVLEDGEMLESIYNEGKDEWYRWRRVGDIEDMAREREQQFEEARTDVIEYGKKTGGERLVVLDAKTGKRLEAEDGTPDGIILTDAIMALINDSNNAVRLTHNHPKSLSFSMEDIIVASKPGAESIEAVGHDGSWYRAKLKTADVDLEAKISEINDEVMNRLGKLVSSKKIKLDSAGQLYHHIANLALAKIGVIDYEYQLSAPQEKMWMSLEIELNTVVREVATQVGSVQP